MPQYSIQFDMSFSDLWTLLFQKKTCAQCGAGLQRHTVREGTGPTLQREGGCLNLNVWYGDRVSLRFVYRCDNCRVTNTLTQLRLGLPGVPIGDTTETTLPGPDV